MNATAQPTPDEAAFGDPNKGVSASISGSPAPEEVTRSLDPGFRRNIKILGVVLALAIVAIVVIVVRSQSSIKQSKDSAFSKSAIESGTSMSTATDNITQPEIDRIVRVGQEQSAQAAQKGQTFIPDNLPLNSVPQMPNAGQGPGAGYSAQTGRHNGTQEDAQRDQNRQQGLQVQLQSLLKGLEAPPTQSASPYERKDESESQAAQAPAQTPQGNPTASATDLVAGLSIHGAVLTSPLDTEKTDYVSARIVSGPATGALLFGTGVVVGGEGVRLRFNLMSFKERSYEVNVVALDTQTSSNAMSADIDRKLFSRYVIPIFGAMGKAYADAVARPNQQVVVEGGAVNVVTPTASAKQAAAAGVGAGIGKVTEAATYNGPNTAHMPVNSSIGVLFMQPVKKKEGS